MRRVALLFAAMASLAGCSGTGPSGRIQAPSAPPGPPTSTSFRELTASRDWLARPLARRLGLQSAVAGNVTVNLNSGWNAVAIQGPQLSSLSVNGTIPGFATWDGTGYQTHSFTAAAINGRQGLYVFSQGSSSFTYSAVDDVQGRKLNLTSGWNLVSFADPGPITNVTTSKTPLNSVLLTTFYKLNPDNSQTGVEATSALDGTRPYWIYAAENVTISWTSPAPLPSPTPTPSPSPDPTPPPGGGGGGGGPLPTPTPTPIQHSLRFAAWPSSTLVAPLPADTVLTWDVEVLGPDGTRLPAGNDAVTVSLDAGNVPVGAVLSGTATRTAASGLASYGAMGVNKVGVYYLRATAPGCHDAVSPALYIGPGAPNKLAFANYPLVATVSEVALPISIQLQDAKGNPTGAGALPVPVQLGITPGANVADGNGLPVQGTLDAFGRVSFFDSRIDTAGTFRLTAAAPGGILPALMPADLLVDTPPAVAVSSLTFGTPFPTGTAGVPLGPVVVQVRDAGNAIIPTADGVMQLQACNCNPAPGALYEEATTIGTVNGTRVTTMAAPVVNGIATFTPTIIRAGQWNVQATYSKGSLYTVTQTVVVQPAATALLTFTPQAQDPNAPPVNPPVNPVDAIANATLEAVGGPNPVATNPVSVEVRDQFGNRVLTENRDVTMAFATNGRSLQGTLTGTPSAGLANFNGLYYPGGRLGVQQLVATLGSLTGVSAPFQVFLEPVSVENSGTLNNRVVNCNNPNTCSADGRYVVFEKANLDGNGFITGYHIYRRDRQTGTTLQIDPGPDTVFQTSPAISPNGQYVSWTANAEYGGITAPINPNSGQKSSQVYVWHDGTTKLVSRSLASAGVGADRDCATSDVNDSGLVVFDTQGTNLAVNHRPAYQVYTGNGGVLQRISESAPGVASNSGLFNVQAQPSIANTGHVVWTSYAPDLPGDWAFVGFGLGVFRRLPSETTVQLVNENPAFPGRVVNGFTTQPAISDNGRYVAYQTQSADLPSDVSTRSQVYRRDCNGPATAFVLVSEGGAGAGTSLFGSGSGYPSLSADGRYVAFVSTEGLRGEPLPQQGFSLVYRRDCDNPLTPMIGRQPGGRIMVPQFSCWPSLASQNPALCVFFSDQGVVYNPPVGQAYMTYVPLTTP